MLRSLKTGPFRSGVFRASFPGWAGAENDEGIEVFGRAEGIHIEARCGRDFRSGDLPPRRDQPGDLLQLEKEIRRAAADGEKRLKQLEDENGKLRKLVADLSLDKEMLQDVIRRKM